MTGERTKRPLLLGHRGARGRKSIPENTFASFDQALVDGCDGFEFDVRLTADGRAVVCHDPQAGGVEIASASAEQCAVLPLFEDVLARYGEQAFLDIELKVAGLENGVLRALKRNPPGRGFVVSSFVPDVLRVMHAEDSAIALGLICEKRTELIRWTQLPVEYVIPERKLVTVPLVEELKAAGKKILVWTINTRVEMERLRDRGVDGIISDETGLLARTLG
jgi:glycerophosphoryl diester phosphodiesterase